MQTPLRIAPISHRLPGVVAARHVAGVEPGQSGAICDAAVFVGDVATVAMNVGSWRSCARIVGERAARNPYLAGRRAIPEVAAAKPNPMAAPVETSARDLTGLAVASREAVVTGRARSLVVDRAVVHLEIEAAVKVDSVRRGAFDGDRRQHDAAPVYQTDCAEPA